jgi:dihydroorotate dehydrogenase
MIWRSVGRSILFKFPAEWAHHFSMGAFAGLSSIPAIPSLVRSKYTVNDVRLNTKVFGMPFANPVGLAAGFDKDAKWFPDLANLGFSHVEVGTLTGQGQVGNPKPRLFRLPADKAIINRMGFNNEGADAAARRLAKTPKASAKDILGINIGKTKVVPVEEATSDYLFSFERLFSYADYFTVNVSSPNTPGLRTLQNREPLVELLTSLQELNGRLSNDHEVATKPILLKIAPDLGEGQLEDIVSIVKETGLSGLIATNTTISRDGLKSPASMVSEIGNGGLSGSPLTVRSRNVVSQAFKLADGAFPVIGVGGIMNGDDAWAMIGAGASLVQLYTGFIYGGPSIVKEINKTILRRITELNLNSVQDAVGRDL